MQFQIVKVELPVIQSGLPVGTIKLKSREILPSENPIQFTCTSRTECCSEMRIPTSSHDIERIMKHGFELDQIVKDLSPIILNANSPYRKQKAYILKTKPYEGSCTFLENKLCKIHEYKPFACRIYPFELDFIDENTINVIIHQDQLCDSINAVPPSKAQNKKLLENLYEIIKDEMEQRNYSIKDF